MVMTSDDEGYLGETEYEVEGTPITDEDTGSLDYEFEDLLEAMDEEDSIFDKMVSPLVGLIDDPSRYEDEMELEGTGDSLVMLAGAYESKMRRMKTAARVKAAVLVVGVGAIGYFVAKKDLLSGRGKRRL